MSETVIMFWINDGVITHAAERWVITRSDDAVLTDPRDIEVAVARVANTPVGGQEEHSNKEK